jgi:hypothetical protein
LGVMSELAFAGPFSDQFQDANISLELRQDTVLPSIYTWCVLPGLYAHVWKGLLDQKPWAPCAKCEKYFIVTRPGRNHCSFACKNAAKQHRYRQRQQESLRSPQERKGTQ